MIVPVEYDASAADEQAGSVAVGGDAQLAGGSAVLPKSDESNDSSPTPNLQPAAAIPGVSEVFMSETPLPLGPTKAEGAEQPRIEVDDDKLKLAVGNFMRVNDDVITHEEILEVVWPKMEIYAQRSPSLQHYRQNCQILVSDELKLRLRGILLYQAAMRNPDERVTQQIDFKVEKLRNEFLATYDNSPAKTERALRQQGTTLQRELDRKRREEVITIYERRKFLPQVHTTRKELMRYYRENEDEFSLPGKVHMKLIEVRPEKLLENPSRADEHQRQLAREKALAKAEEAFGRLRRGFDFEAVATDYSDGIKAKKGGDWGDMTPGSFGVEQINDALKEMEAGQISEVIETERSFYIVKAENIRRPQTITFEQAQEQIRRKIDSEKIHQLQTDHLKELFDEASISHYQSFIDAAVELVPPWVAPRRARLR